MYDPWSHLRGYRADPLSGWYEAVKTSFTRELWQSLATILPERPAILEIGPGHGHFARIASTAGGVYDAVEPADFFRERLRADGFRVSDESVPPIPRDDASYDLLLASMVLENMPSTTEAAGLVAESARVLRPSGLFCVIFPNYLTWGRFFFDEHYTHNWVTTPRRVAHLLASQGFRIRRSDHVLGWFWAQETILRNLLRLTVNALMVPLHWVPVERAFGLLRLDTFHWKVRKTLFESVIVVAERVTTEPD